MFTSIRELIENSLDAAESIHVLPEIELTITEETENEYNISQGHDLARQNSNSSTSSQEKGSSSKETLYYSVTCKDNGCGIHSDNIGDMLGRVLTGSKHGLRQTRGKFGLGAKMVCFLFLHCLYFDISLIFQHSN